MTADGRRTHREYARDARRSGDYAIAANYYTAAYHESMGESRTPPQVSSEDSSIGMDLTEFGYGIESLLRAALCYRLGSEPRRAENRCREGIVVVEDVCEHERGFDEPARQGLCREILGDLKLVGGLGEYEREYAAAEGKYSPYDDTHRQVQWQAEPEFEFVIGFALELADAVGYEFGDRERHRILARSLDDRIAFKRDRYPTILERVLDAGEWPPRDASDEP